MFYYYPKKTKGNPATITFGFFVHGYLPRGLNFLLHSSDHQFVIEELIYDKFLQKCHYVVDRQKQA